MGHVVLASSSRPSACAAAAAYGAIGLVPASAGHLVRCPSTGFNAPPARGILVGGQ
jgi:hypothetical protein